jgi:protein SCO1
LRNATRVLWGAVLAAALSAPGSARAGPGRARDGEAKARDWFTDTVLLTQDGQRVRFYSDVLEGRVVSLNFIFTRCADACPLITQKLKAAKEELGGLFGKPVRFVSISVDPEFDTPARMKEFARRNRAEHPEWLFLTGKPRDVEKVLKRLGETVGDPGDHSTALVAGNTATRHWTKIRPDAPPVAVAEHLRRLAGEEIGGARAAGAVVRE